MHLRRYNPNDLTAISAVAADCFSTDPLTMYLHKNIHRYPVSFRQFLARELREVVREPESICWVMETDDRDEIAGEGIEKRKGEREDEVKGGEIVGWCVWGRRGESQVARNWRKKEMGVWDYIETRLFTLTKRYHNLIDPTVNHRHNRNVMPLLKRPLPRYMRECWEILSLGVAPRHQRRGLGSMMINWGLEQARVEGVPVFVRASPAGRKAYEKLGFVKVEELGFGDLFEGGEDMAGLVWDPGSENKKRNVCEETLEREEGDGKKRRRDGAWVVSARRDAEAWDRKYNREKEVRRRINRGWFGMWKG